MTTVENLSLSTGALLRDAMRLIDKEASGICFIVNGTHLIGMITDGDIRRSLLEGYTIDAVVDDVMKKNFFFLRPDTTIQSIQEHLLRFDYIPIINYEGDFVDFATSSQYHQIPLVQPLFDGKELEYATECIRSGWISSQGKYVGLFENKFGEYVSSPNCLTVSNGTVGLHLALVALGVGPGDEVIVPNLTFAATINAVLYVGATPVMVDVDSMTMTIDPSCVFDAITSKTRAMIPVHLYGHPADMGSLMTLAEKNNLLVIEDCAEALGSKYNNIHVGIFGHAAIFSFFGNKTITTGEGGMVLFRDAHVLERARILRGHGMAPNRRYWHDEIGFNYRLTNIQAAIGLAQIERVDKFVDRKRWIAMQYKTKLANIEGIQLPSEAVDCLNSYWLYTVVLSQKYASRRNEILLALSNKGIEARPVFFPLNRMPPYERFQYYRTKNDVSYFLSNGGVSLPSGLTLSEADIGRICDVFATCLLAN